jgi:hypothetical protein
VNLIELFQLGSASLEFFIQSALPRGGDCGPWIMFGSAFNSITAAWATLGYYAQADVLYYMNGGWQKFAILLYTGAGIAGIASMAFGQPPKMWVWFFIGPAVYYFAIDTRQPVHGVGWMIGSYVQDQSEVWKQAEAGAANSGVVRRGEIGFNATGPQPGLHPTIGNPDGTINVSVPFLMLDSIVSDTVRQLSVWSGSLSQVSTYEENLPSTSTNIALESNAPGYYFGKTLESQEVCEPDQVHFSVVSNTKWTYLNSVTQAELGNTDARDAFARFMASECGSHLSDSVDFTNYSKALNFKDRDLPASVLFQDTSVSSSQYKRLRRNLGKQRVPTPPTLRRLFAESLQVAAPNAAGSSFLRSVDWSPSRAAPTATPIACGEPQAQADTAFVESVLSRDIITCDAYLYMLLLYFRYEAAVIFSQTFQSAGPTGWYPHDMTYNMLYGWDIPYETGCATSEGLSIGVQTQFVYNLILAHLFRNEMNRLPELVTVGKDKTEAIIDDSQLYNASIGSTSKAAEVYTWSLMIPYVQGILLYLLTMAFPIVCMLMLVPSWMKIIVTWTSFFVWVKLWDLGFAFVSSLERTLWAQMANSNASREVSGKVLEMSQYGGFYDVVCNDGFDGLEPTGACTESPTMILTGGRELCSSDGYDTCLNIFNTNVTTDGYGAFDASLRIFDLGLLVGSSLDFDIANGYYIYIMSALYFAVPAVTGQLVLGAKSGVAGMVDKIAGDPAGKAGNAAGQSYTGNETARVKQNAATTSQESLAKGHRENGLVDKALGQQNQAAEHGRLAAEHGQVSEGLNRRAQAIASANEYAGAAYQVPKTALTAAMAPLKSDRPKRPSEPDPNVVDSPGNGGTGGDPQHATHSSEGNSTLSSNIKGQASLASGAVGSAGMRKRLSGAGTPGGMLANMGGYAGVAGWAADSALNISEAAWNAERTRAVTDSRNEASALAGEQGIHAYGAQQRSSAYRSASERTMAQAQFAAQTAQYDAMNNYSNQRAGRMAVLGVPPGMIGPERRPEDAMGMAMAGMLDAPGRETRRKANFFDPSTGSFFNTINSSEKGLHGQYGYNGTRQPYLSGIKSELAYFGDSLRAGGSAISRMGVGRDLPPESEK